MLPGPLMRVQIVSTFVDLRFVIRTRWGGRLGTRTANDTIAVATVSIVDSVNGGQNDNSEID